MTHTRTAALVALSSTLSVLLGCAARSKTVVVNPLETDLGTYTDVVVSVESRVPQDLTKEMTDLEGLTVSRIKTLARFKTVSVESRSSTSASASSAPKAAGKPAPTKAVPAKPKVAPKPSDKVLLVKLAIVDAKKVGGTKRFMLGAFAGRAHMTTEIAFVHARSGKALGTYTVTGESGGSGYSGGTSDAVMKAADAVGQLISQNFGAQDKK